MNAHAFPFSRNRIAALAAAATSILLTGAVCRAATNPLGCLTYTQTVTAAFATPAEAAAATLSATPLPQGAKRAFTTRWDDSNWAHRSKAAMLRRAGYKGTFFLNENEKFFREVAPELLAGGHALGNHSLSHPFLTESAPNLVFREILRNRVLIESRCDTTVVSFVIPFNWGSPVDTERPSFIGNILVNTGHYVSSDWPLDAIGLPPDTWMPAHTFSADDGQPNAERFAQNLKKALDDAEKTPEIPRVAFGIHSWCKEDGERVQEACLRQVRGNPDWFYGNDNEYGAYRYSALHGAIRKTGVQGTRAVFEVERFAPSQLGSLQPLSLAFSGADPTAVSVAGTALQADVRGLYTLPHAPEWTLPKAVDLAAPDGTSAKIPGIRFTLAPDENAGMLAATFRNDSAADFTDLCLVVNPPPAWEKGRIIVRLPRLAAGNRRRLRGWGWALTGGIVDVLLGIMLAAAPAPAATAVLIYFVGFWIMLRSLWAIGGASELSALGVRGWGWLLALAIASFIFSLVFIFSSPIFGGAFVVAFFSTAIIAYGLFRIWLAVKLKAVKDAAMPE